MGYCQVSDLYAEISTADVLAFADDNSTGMINDPSVQTILNTVINRVSQKIDGALANIYDVPINPVPAKLYDICVTLSCEALYRRRLTPDEKNPFHDQAEKAREWLEDISNGKKHLDLNVPRDYPQGAVVSSPMIVNYGQNTL